ncbi:MAG: hypothetical protein MJ223_02705 [Mycoplasmoidaceae bacterium]|nr:hypothetical protein [Mycoplasmoidaceae bacterium]
MYKANSNEGLISGRFKNDNPKAFAEKKLQKERQQQYTLESISDDLYFKNGF